MAELKATSNAALEIFRHLRTNNQRCPINPNQQTMIRTRWDSLLFSLRLVLTSRTAWPTPFISLRGHDDQAQLC